MAFDLSILAQPLASKRNPNDFANLGNSISRGIQQRDNREQREITNAQNSRRTEIAERTEARQGAADAAEIEAKGLTEVMEQYEADLVKSRFFLKSGDLQGAQNVIADRQIRNISEKKVNPDLNIKDTESLLSLSFDDPGEFERVIEGELVGLGNAAISGSSSFGKLGKVFKNGVVVQGDDNGQLRVTNQSGVEVKGEDRAALLQEAYNAERDGTKSAAEVKQIMDLASFKANVGRNFAKESLDLRKLEQQIETGNFNLESSKETKEKGLALKSDTLRIVKELQTMEAAVKSLVGPFDNSFASPTFFEDTLGARTLIGQLQSILTADNLKLMTGVLSETDIKIIAKIAGGGLDINGSQDGFIKELGRLNTTLTNEIGGQGGQTLNFDAQGNQI